MKKNLSKLCCILLALIFSISTNPVFADSKGLVSYNIDSAVRTGLNNSVILKQIDYKLTLSRLKYDSYDKSGDELVSGDKDLSKGGTDLGSGLNTIDANQDLLNQAKIDILNGYYPQGFPDAVIIPNVFSVTSDHDSDDSNRRTIVKQLTDFNNATGAGLDVNGVVASITSTVNKEIASQQKTLDKGKIDYEKKNSYFVNGKIDYEIAKASIASALSEKLDISELNKLSAAAETNLLLKMADAATTITVASKGIYKNQVALLIQNSYYNVLKAKKLVEVKESTMKRAETQYKFAKDGYESGMKAKDDMLLADMYYTGTMMEYEKAEDDYNNALVELKKNMNIPMDQYIELEDVSMDGNPVMDLKKGLDYGLSNRLEIIKAEQAIEVYKLNADYVKIYYHTNSTRYSEALNLKSEAELELEKAQKDVESSIRQSFNTLLTMDSMLETAKGMVDQARECLTIAQDKYREGFGTDSSLLKKVGMESASGTVLEVISAEENLAQVEEKYIQILYGYNLAKAKYLNDIGYLTY